MSWLQTSLQGKQLLVNMDVNLEELSYTLHLTDLINTWEEKVGGEEFKARWQRLNSDLEGMEEADGLKEIRDAVQNMAKVNDDSKREIALKVKAEFGEEEKDVSLKLSWVSDGLPLCWEATLALGDVQLTNKSITRPLINCLSILLNQRATLVNNLRAKDLELEDMRSSGAEVSLPQLRTKWFNSDSFLAKDFQLDKEIENPIDFLCSTEMSSLLEVKLKKNGSDSKVHEEVSKEVVDGSEPRKKKVKVGPNSSPMKLSSKVAVARPDLSKLAVVGSREKKAKLSKL